LISNIDFSRYISPDDWKTCIVSSPNRISIPELTTEYEYCWESNIVHAFIAENLQYGVRPMAIYDIIQEGGGGPVLLDKENGYIYQIGSGIWVNYNYIEEFSLYKQNKLTQIDWEAILWVS
jgi:hypothetical protein